MRKTIKQEIDAKIKRSKDFIDGEFPDGISTEKHTCHGGYSFGYEKGKISAYEDCFDLIIEKLKEFEKRERKKYAIDLEGKDQRVYWMAKGMERMLMEIDADVLFDNL